MSAARPTRVRVVAVERLDLFHEVRRRVGDILGALHEVAFCDRISSFGARRAAGAAQRRCMLCYQRRGGEHLLLLARRRDERLAALMNVLRRASKQRLIDKAWFTRNTGTIRYANLNTININYNHKIKPRIVVDGNGIANRENRQDNT